MIPGEYILAADGADLPLNPGLETRKLIVANTGDRPIQVGSHYHFYEVNTSLSFDRSASLGSRSRLM